jgi:hypothetical protein
MRSSSTADSKDRLGLAAISVGSRRHYRPSEPGGRRFGAPGSGKPWWRPGWGRRGCWRTAGAVWMAAAAVGVGEPDDGGSAVCPGFHRPPPRDREATRLPPVFSSPAPPDGTGTASAFTPGSAPRGYPQRMPGRRRANAHWPGYRTYGLSRTSNSTSHLTHVPSRRTRCTVASMVSRRAVGQIQACPVSDAYLLRVGCSSKKRMSSALASGPRGSV